MTTAEIAHAPTELERLRAPGPATPSSPKSGDWPQRILVVTNGGEESDAAVIRGRDIARRTGASGEMIAVYSTRIPLPRCPDRHGFEQCEEPDRRAAAELLRGVRRQRMRLLADRRERTQWPLRLEVGEAAATVVRVADEEAVDLVVMGVGHVEAGSLRCEGRTAVYAVRYLEVPLYGTTADADGPSRCVVALPDGRIHAPTIRAAVGCLSGGAQVWIAVPRDPRADPGPSYESILMACRQVLSPTVDRTIVGVIPVDGDMLTGVLHAADTVEAQVIAVPNRGGPGAVRAFLPNLGEPLLTSARCSVLVVPDERAAAPH